MICAKCGANNDDGDKFCQTCGNPLAAAAAGEPVAAAGQDSPANEAPANPAPAGQENGGTQETVGGPSSYVETANPMLGTEPVTPQPAINQGAYNGAQGAAAPEQNISRPGQDPNYFNPRRMDPNGGSGNVYQQTAEQKKKKKGGAGIFIVLGIIAAIAVVLFLTRGLWGDLIARTFQSPPKYAQTVIKNTLNANDLAGVYNDMVYDNINNIDNAGFTMEGSVKLSDDMIDEIADQTGVDDLDALKDLSFSMKMDHKGDLSGVTVTLSSGKTKLATLENVIDSDEGYIYSRIPELNETFMMQDAEILGGKDTLEQMQESLEKMAELGKALPDGNKLNKMWMKYLTAGAKGITDVDKSKETLKIEGVKQDLLTLEMELDEDMLSECMNGFCDEMLDDKDLQKMVEAIAESMDQDGDDAWDDIEASLERYKKNADNLDFGKKGSAGTLRLYVGKGGIAQAVELETDDQRLLFGYAESGGERGMTMTMERNGNDYMKIGGKGKISGGKYSGPLTFEQGGTEVMELELKDFDMESWKKGNIKGTVIIEMEQLSKSTGRSRLGSFEDYTLELTVETTTKSAEFDINVLDGKKDVLTAQLTMKNGKADVAKPAEKKCIEIEDDDDLDDYAEDIDADKFIANFEKAGFPDEIVEGLEDALDDPDADTIRGLMNMVSGFGGMGKYINKSKTSAATQYCDTIHTAVLTAMMDPEVVNDPGYFDSLSQLQNYVFVSDAVSYDSNVILEAALEIMGKEDWIEVLSDLDKYGCYGITIYAPSDYSIQVTLQGVDDGYGDYVTVQ